MNAVRIVAAAIKKNGVVFTGVRHGFIIRDMVAVGFITDVVKDYVSGDEQGFIDSNNIYHNRDGGRTIAIGARQIPSTHGTLYSEDLW